MIEKVHGMIYTSDIESGKVRGAIMNKARVFTNGRSQAVRIPKEYRFDVDEVFITKIGDVILLTPVDKLAAEFEEGAKMLTDDFLKEGIPKSIEPERIDF